MRLSLKQSLAVWLFFAITALAIGCCVLLPVRRTPGCRAA